MVGPVEIGYDIAAESAAILLLPLLWLVLFYLAWEDRPFAESVGFGRTTFWLLTATVVLAFYAELPLFPFTGDIVGINIGGGLLPLVLSAVLFARFVPPRSRSVPAFVGIFGGEAAISFALVVTVAAPWSQALGVVAVAIGATAAAGLLAAPLRLGRAFPVLVGLSSGVLVATYLYSSASPQIGISETFPAYLLAPIAAGALAAALAPSLFGTESGRALPLAYASATFGVILGADLLRQPPLYGGSTSAFYVIGGANFLDLVYLSGLLSLVVAYAMLRSREGTIAPVPGGPAPPPPSPLRTLAEASREALGGTPSRAVRRARDASRAAADRAHRLLGHAPAPAERPWSGLGAPGWIVADQANLDAVAEAGDADTFEAHRAVQTARGMVSLSRRVGRERFASLRARTIATAIDLLLVTVPVVALWFAYDQSGAAGTAGGFGLPLEVAAYGYIALAYLYFALVGRTRGGTIGKRWLGIQVTDRRGEAIGLLPSFVRESPKLVPISVTAIFGPAVVALLTNTPWNFAGYPATSSPTLLALFLGLAVVTIAVSALVGLATIALSDERQRVGDHWAGTWVVRPLRPTPMVPSGAPGEPSSASPGS